MPDRWSAILTVELMQEYLGNISYATLRRRLRSLGLPPRNAVMGGWHKEEVDQAIRELYGHHATVDGREWLEALNDQT